MYPEDPERYGERAYLSGLSEDVLGGCLWRGSFGVRLGFDGLEDMAMKKAAIREGSRRTSS